MDASDKGTGWFYCSGFLLPTGKAQLEDVTRLSGKRMVEDRIIKFAVD